MATIVASDLDSIIQKASLKYNVPVPLIKAIIQTESSWNPSAYRAEPKINDASWGLMQVLLKTAREVSGISGLTASELLKPETNISIGTAYLGKQLKRYKGNINDAMAAYNAGTAIRKADGTYINQGYVDRANRWFAFYKSKEVLTSAGIGLPLLALGTVSIGYFLLEKKR